MRKETIDAANILLKRIDVLNDAIQKFNNKKGEPANEEEYLPKLRICTDRNQDFYSHSITEGSGSKFPELQIKINDLMYRSCDQILILLKREKTKLEKEFDNLKEQ